MVTQPFEASDPAFKQWIHDQFEEIWRVLGIALFRVFVFRVSATDPAQFAANFDTAMYGRAGVDPDLDLARMVGPVLVERTPYGEAARIEHRTQEIRVGMLEDGGTSTRRVGYATVFGSSLFIYLLGSAATKDLPVARHPEDRGNAATEVVRTTVRIVCALGSARTECHKLEATWPDATRAVRAGSTKQDLLETLRYYGVTVVLSGRRFDTHNPDDYDDLDKRFSDAAADRRRVVERFEKRKAELLAEGKLPANLVQAVPHTHGPRDASVPHPNGDRTFLDHLSPHPIEGAGPLLAKTVRRFIELGDLDLRVGLAAPDLDAIAITLCQEFDLLARGARERKRGLRLDDLESPGKGLQRMFSEDFVVAWRTGWLTVSRRLAVAVPKDDRLTLVETLPGGLPHVEAKVRCPIPPGLDLEQWEWERLLYLLSLSRGPGRPQSGFQKPFVGQRRIVGDLEHDLSPSDSYYRVEQRQLPLPGERTGWPRNPAAKKAAGIERLLSVRAVVLQSAIGSELSALASELESKAATLSVRTGPAPRPRDHIESRINELKHKAATLEKAAEGFLLLASLAAEADNIDERDASLRARTQSLEDLTGVRADLVAAEADGEHAARDEEESQEAEIRISTLEEVSAALQVDWPSTSFGTGVNTTEGSMPLAVCQAVRAIFGQSLWIESGPAPNRAVWTATARIWLRDGRLGSFELSGEIPATTRAGAAIRNPARLAHDYLWLGKSFEEVGAEHNIDGSGETNSHLPRLIKQWLGDPQEGGAHLHIPSVDRRRLLLDAPAGARRAMYGILTGREAELLAEGYDPLYLDLLREVYLSTDDDWGESWTSGPFDHQRRVISFTLEDRDPARGALVLEAARLLNLTYDQVLLTVSTRKGADPVIGSRNWVKRGVELEHRTVFLVPCPWEDCPGFGRAFASHYLHVPEVPGALLCPTCRRSPYRDQPHAGARFPDCYFQLHRRRTEPEDGTRVGTRLDTTRSFAVTLRPRRRRRTSRQT